MSIGQNIHALRKANRWSITTLAEMTGLSRATIWGIEKGSARPSFDSIQKIAFALGVSLDYLATGTDDAYQNGWKACQKWLTTIIQIGTPPCSNLLTQSLSSSLSPSPPSLSDSSLEQSSKPAAGAPKPTTTT